MTVIYLTGCLLRVTTSKVADTDIYGLGLM